MSLFSRTERVVDPGDLLDLAAGGRRAFWLERPVSGEALLGIGVACAIEAEGAHRFEDAAARIREASRSILRSGDGNTPTVWLGGFGFADRSATASEWRELPALRFVVPALLWQRDGQGVRLTRTGVSGSEEELDHLVREVRSAASLAVRPGAIRAIEPSTGTNDAEAFLARVTAAKRAIDAGEIDKVVLSRGRELVLSPDVSADHVVRRARDERPECWTFLVRGEETAFVGSTPEPLVRRRGGHVAAAAIAGSSARGPSGREDERLGAALLACAKNAREHRLVVDAIVAALAPVARALDVDARPSLLRLPEAQHLRTRIRAVLDADHPLLELAARLHPTPAVCGVPREAARRRIEREEAGRGWYTGAVGWLTEEGDGELVVALRSALIDGDRMIVRAGAGIVAGSEPALELAETEAKLAALLRSSRAACAA